MKVGDNTEPQEVMKRQMKLVAIETTDYVFVCYGNEEVPEGHNCDHMGCSSLYHVKYKFKKP
jgi:hypothetical protein